MGNLSSYPFVSVHSLLVSVFILLGKVQAFLVVRLGPGRNGTTTPSWLESEVSYVFLAILVCLYFHKKFNINLSKH